MSVRAAGRWRLAMVGLVAAPGCVVGQVYGGPAVALAAPVADGLRGGGKVGVQAGGGLFGVTVTAVARARWVPDAAGFALQPQVCVYEVPGGVIGGVCGGVWGQAEIVDGRRFVAGVAPVVTPTVGFPLEGRDQDTYLFISAPVEYDWRWSSRYRSGFSGALTIGVGVYSSML